MSIIKLNPEDPNAPHYAGRILDGSEIKALFAMVNAAEEVNLVIKTREELRLATQNLRARIHSAEPAYVEAHAALNASDGANADFVLKLRNIYGRGGRLIGVYVPEAGGMFVAKEEVVDTADLERAKTTSRRWSRQAAFTP